MNFKEENNMAEWLINIPDEQACNLRRYGEIIQKGSMTGAGGYYFKLVGDSLQEAADKVLLPLAYYFSGGCTIIERPEHVRIEDNLYGYANVADRHIKIIIPCTCKRHGVQFEKEIVIYVEEQRIDIAEMRSLLNESRAAFSRRYNIPVRTLENWESGKSQCPEYVRELLERAVKEDAQSK